jgi:DNA-binding FadR family transcriptional regulator
MSVVTEAAVHDSAPINLGRRPLCQEIQRHIRSYIFERGLKPGEMLPPAPEMASYLGVSLASLREGMRAMEALGMLETKHGIGTFVRTYNLIPVFETLSFSLLIDEDGLYKMTQIRESMEVGLIREVVAKIEEDDLRALEHLCAETSQSGWSAEFDMPFHRQIYRCLNNELVAQILDIYWMASTALIDSTFFTHEDRLDNWHDHHQIAVSLRERDPEAAIESMRKHFARAKARMNLSRSGNSTA